MRKFYSLLMLAAIGANSLAVDAANYTIVVKDDAALSSLVINGEEVAAGKNLYMGTYESSFEATAYAAEGYAIQKVTKAVNGNETQTGTNRYSYAEFYDYYGGDVTFVVYTTPYVEATVNLIADVDSVASIFMSNTYRRIWLDAGETKIDFIPEVENLWTFQMGSGFFYSVVLNDSVLTQYDKREYKVSVEEGAILTLDAQWPDVDYTVTFDVPDENVLSFVGINNDFNLSYTWDSVEWANGVTSKAGSKVYFQSSPYYKFNHVVLNGDTLAYFNGSYTINPLMEDVNVVIDAEVLPLYTVTLDIDDPDNLRVSYSTNTTSLAMELQPGENVFQLPYNESDNRYYVYISAKAGGFEITKCLVNGVEASPLSWDKQSYRITIADSMNIVVETFAPDRLEEMAVYLESSEIDASLPYINSNCNYYYALETGYNSLLFDGALDNPFTLGTLRYATEGTPYVYLNGQQLAPTTEGGYYFKFSAEEYDVVKIFQKEPAQYSVYFHGATDAAEMYMDRIQLVDKPDYVVFQGTEIAIITANEVKVNDETITAESGRMYVVTVNEDVDIEIVADETGINGIATEAKKMEGIYNMQGVRLNSDLNALPSGIYIVNGEKRIVR
ncbi:MAG: hypothetical protein LIO90_01720 [Bacteroidales bacterium]|nr:hypothetical protein [Bacteroidales bacterium]